MTEAQDRLLEDLSREKPITKTIRWCQVHDTIANRFYCAYGEERNHRGLRVNCYTVEMLLTPVEQER